jgi:hypothetical protein
VSVANRDSTPLKGWKLWFVMPGDQTLSGNGKVPLKQADGAVTVSSKDELQAQATKTMQVTGRYKESNAAPKVFKLDNETCETYVSGKPGAPSQPVQHLSDGTTKLGPVPPSSTPVPGLSTDTSGVVVPVPVRTTTGPGVIPTTTTPGTVITTNPGAKPPSSNASTTPADQVTTSTSSTPTSASTTSAAAGEDPPTNPPVFDPEGE